MGADAVSASTNTNISSTTRDCALRSVVDEVFLGMPLLAKLYLRQQMSWTGGTNITRPIKIANMDSVYQAYSPGEQLTSGRVATLTKPWFTWGYTQVPSTYTLEEYLQNGGDDMK
ncbi:MAG TPA: hypothetical protein VMY35_13215, partial [Phycisphaerae bacterium]|nr:hypothetical protein [Phycisphaerae bacterium]